MDTRIYFPQNRSDLGNYLARRIPKSYGAVASGGLANSILDTAFSGGGSGVDDQPAAVQGSIPQSANPLIIPFAHNTQQAGPYSVIAVTYTVPKARRAELQSARMCT